MNSGVSGGGILTAYMLVPAVDDFTGQLCKVTVVDNNDNYYSNVYNLIGTDKEAATGSLKAEKVYTFNATLKADKWAASNVYWNGSKLTFDEPYEMGHSAAQGLFFKWGSLVGISPAGEDESPWTGITYTNGATTNPGNEPIWDNINDTDPDATASNAKLDSDYDICTQINEAYRMPTQSEAQLFYSNHLSQQQIGTIGTITTEATDGTEAIYIGILYDGFLFIPNSGLRDIDGSLHVVGTMGTFWSNTAYDDVDAYTLLDGYDKTSAPPVRCIKKTAEEE
jgi:hypothetical protein